MRLRRRTETPSAAPGLEERLVALEQRVEDLEDAISLTWLDELADRVDDLSLRAATQDDLLTVRLYAARVAAELDRVEARLAQRLADHVAGRDQAATA